MCVLSIFFALFWVGKWKIWKTTVHVGQITLEWQKRKKKITLQQLLMKDININVEGFGKYAKILERKRAKVKLTPPEAMTIKKCIRSLECIYKKDEYRTSRKR